MPKIWFAIKRSLDCKSSMDVHDPEASSSSSSSSRNHKSSMRTRNLCRSVCSRSIMNIKDVIHGSVRRVEKRQNRHVEKTQNVVSSPRFLGSNEFHDKGGSGSPLVGRLRPGTLGPGGQRILKKPTTPSRKVLAETPVLSSGDVGACSSPRGSYTADSRGSSTLVCQKCGKDFKNFDAVEAHHLSKHAVTELVEGDSSRKIVEIICRISSFTAENNHGHIERVLKVHNIQRTLAEFEDYREMVKIKANKLWKKHPRCLADGNELLRFYGTSVACSLGLDGSSSLCSMEKCGVCQILRHGFSIDKDSIGVFTTSTFEAAIAYIELNDINLSTRKALIVCRVIAGRTHRPSQNFPGIAGQSEFDSMVGKVDRHCNIEELYLLNPKALLPCFVVICRP